MKFDRRKFLKLSTAAAAITTFGGIGLNLASSIAKAKSVSIAWAKEVTSICCYCAVGCGLLVQVGKESNAIANIEGDPDHPINEGALCAKGSAIFQLVDNERRIKHALYRAPKSDKWEVKPHDWMIDTIAKRIKDSRDKTFVTKNKKGQIVNRCDGIASVGSAALDNEECWSYQAILRALGITAIEHQARI